MPWSTSDVKRHTKKAKSGAAKKQWTAVANSTRKRLMAKGVSTKEADRRAVVSANSVVKNRKRKK